MRRKPKKSVTNRDIARLAGVSCATVSRAFEKFKKAKIHPATQAKVLAVAARFNYRPSPVAQRMRSKKSRAICLPIVEGGHHTRTGVGRVSLYLNDMIAGAQSVFQPMGYRLEPLFFGSGPEACDALPEMFRAGYFDAIILLHGLGWMETCARKLAEEGCLGVIEGNNLNIGRNFIEFNTQPGSDELVLRELIRQGRKHIYCVLPPVIEAGSQLGADLRRAGVRLHHPPAPSGDLPAAPTLVDLVLSRYPQTDAILTHDEFVGWEIFKLLVERGVKVPEQITVTGVADVRHNFKPLPIVALLYAPMALQMRSMSLRLAEKIMAEEPSMKEIPLPPELFMPEPSLLVLSPEEFRTASAAELRIESLHDKAEQAVLTAAHLKPADGSVPR